MILIQGWGVGATIDPAGGTADLIFGQEEDGNGNFNAASAFNGTFYDIRIWDEARSEPEIALNHLQKLDLSPSEVASLGLVANWQFDGFDGSNEVVDVVSNNNLIIGHATGTGFIASTPVEDLHISENASGGDVVGYVVPSDPDAPRDIAVNGSFRDDYPGGVIYSPNSFGGWTVTQDNVNVVSNWDPGPLGGYTIDLQGNGTTNGAIQQTLNTEVGRQYQVVFALSGNWAGGEAVKDLRVSAGGESVDYSIERPDGWNNISNMMWSDRSFTFTADSTSTDLSFLSTDAPNAYGAAITDVRVIEIPQAVSTILNNDPTLSYDAATGKFYRVVDASVDFAAAQSAATDSKLNGVDGQLLTIRSAYENELARGFATTSNQIWLGATDADTEGEFHWLDGTQLDESFWSGGAAGGATAGSYANFGAGQPGQFFGRAGPRDS